MSTHGGIRPGAGRPPKTEKRVQIWPSVKKTTKAKLNLMAFQQNKPPGEIVDGLVENSDKILVDNRKRKK